MSFHLYTINELYSNADGSNQFIEMTVGNDDDQGFWAGHFIRVTQGGTTHNLTFTANLPSETTANTKVLIATQGFANLGIVTPDFIVPSGFLFTNGGIVNFAGVDSFSYASLPTDGVTSLGRSGSRVPASPTDFAGDTGTLSSSSGGADQGGLDYWSGELTSGRASHGSLVSDILDSAHTFKNDVTYGWVADLLDNKITVANKFAVELGLTYNTADDSISHGMAIAAATTSTSTADAIALIGIPGI